MDLKEFRKIKRLKPKRLYCPMCDKWEEANVRTKNDLGKIVVCIEHHCEVGRFEFLYSDEPEDDVIEVNRNICCSDYEMREVTDNEVTLDNNQLLIPQTFEKTNPNCEDEDRCYDCFFDLGKDIYECKFILEYDEDELKEAGILGEGTSKEKDSKQEEQAKKENVEQKGKEPAKKEDAECEEKQEEKNMVNAVEKVGIAASALDINKISKDLGINFGLNTDTRIQSTILG